MAKHQLTLSPDYVQDWTYIEAVREIFQNALDNQTTNPENEMFFNYEDETLQIGNKTSILTLDTLLLGSTTKRDDENTIGKHGEGYKVALMVLLREGKQVTIYNYGAKEIWTTRLVKSRKFNGAMITEVDVQKKAFFQSVPSHNLTIEINGITQEEFENIKNSNLHLQTDVEKYTTNNNVGDILLDPKHAGSIFVNGLYITNNPKFQYGYSIHPKHIKLDRDRRLINDINLAWVTSLMWRHVDQPELVADLILNDVIDVKYVKERSGWGEEETFNNRVAKKLKDNFIRKHGNRAIPVHTTSDLQKVNKIGSSVEPIIVSEGVTKYLNDVIELPEVLTLTPREQLENWMSKVRHKLSDEEIADFEIIVEDLLPF